MFLVIEPSDEENPEYAYVDVCGIQEDGIEIIDEHGVNHSFALEFSPWEEWLGMRISQSTLKKYSELEIIVHSPS